MEEISLAEAKFHLGVRAREFVEVVNELAAEYNIPAYAMLVMTGDTVAAVVGGCNRECGELLAEANLQIADKLKQLLQQRVMM